MLLLERLDEVRALVDHRLQPKPGNNPASDLWRHRKRLPHGRSAAIGGDSDRPAYDSRGLSEEAIGGWQVPLLDEPKRDELRTLTLPAKLRSRRLKRFTGRGKKADDPMVDGRVIDRNAALEL
ncbi:MAG: hypothetical protein E5V58_01545 [Mesorhizobium sp.]|nr:MAG: hypothetical protein E5V58_01545 [Mesorhizobium sp.]TJV99171.1 MAG: hypothetical protein E5W97_31375 [Mesorhizobium sp.]